MTTTPPQRADMNRSDYCAATSCPSRRAAAAESYSLRSARLCSAAPSTWLGLGFGFGLELGVGVGFNPNRAEHPIEDAPSRAAHVLRVGGGVARPDGGGHGGGPP